MPAAMLVADDIVWETLNCKRPITNLKLREILFFLNLKYLKEKHHPLITDKSFEKWPYGPVIKQVNQNYVPKFGGDDIKYIPDFVYIDNKPKAYTIKTYQFHHCDLAKEYREFIADNLDQFMHYGTFEMINWTHEDPEWKNKTHKFYDLQKSLAYFTKKGII